MAGLAQGTLDALVPVGALIIYTRGFDRALVNPIGLFTATPMTFLVWRRFRLRILFGLFVRAVFSYKVLLFDSYNYYSR